MPVTTNPHRDALLASYSIGLKLRTLRNEKQLTLSRLGAEIGLSSALLSKLESDLMIPTLPTLAKICRAYGIGLGYFFSEPDQHSLSITRKAHMFDQRREQTSPRSIPLHVPAIQSKQISKVIEIPAGATTRVSEFAARTELTGYVLEGRIRISIAGAEEHLSLGDCLVLDTDAVVLVSGVDTRSRLLAVIAR